MITRQTQGILGVMAAQTLLGTLGVSVVESGADPISVTFYRCLIGGLALALHAAWRGRLTALLRLPAGVLALACASGLLMVGNWVLFFTAIQHIGIAVSTIVFHVQPLIVVLLGALFFRERLHLATCAWILLALAGLVLATDIGEGGVLPGGSYLLGLACALGGAVLYALVTLIAKGLKGMNAPQLVTVQCLCGTLLLFAAAPLGPLQVTSGQWGWFLLIGLVHTGGVYVLLYGALPKLSTPLAAVLLFLYPVSAILADAVVYGHHLVPVQYAGFAAILIASLGVTLRWGVRTAVPAPAA
ncbi:DMT family transporter [Rhizobium sp. PAMB 3174]